MKSRGSAVLNVQLVLTNGLIKHRCYSVADRDSNHNNDLKRALKLRSCL